jgi:hypothetical protein
MGRAIYSLTPIDRKEEQPKECPRGYSLNSKYVRHNAS